MIGKKLVAAAAVAVVVVVVVVNCKEMMALLT
jgi:hypothetical protein